jgi:hypothetical protein
MTFGDKFICRGSISHIHLVGGAKVNHDGDLREPALRKRRPRFYGKLRAASKMILAELGTISACPVQSPRYEKTLYKYFRGHSRLSAE